MKNRTLLVTAMLLLSIAFTSCTIVVSDAPPSRVPNYYTNYNETPVYGVREVKNTYVFYNNANKEVAVWVFKPDGVIIRQGQPITGIVKWYSSGKTVRQEVTYVNNVRSGETKIYYDNGALREEGYYSNGVRSGQYKFYKKNGALDSQGMIDKNNMRQWDKKGKKPEQYKAGKYENWEMKDAAQYENKQGTEEWNRNQNQTNNNEQKNWNQNQNTQNNNEQQNWNRNQNQNQTNNNEQKNWNQNQNQNQNQGSTGNQQNLNNSKNPPQGNGTRPELNQGQQGKDTGNNNTQTGGQLQQTGGTTAAVQTNNGSVVIPQAEAAAGSTGKGHGQNKNFANGANGTVNPADVSQTADYSNKLLRNGQAKKMANTPASFGRGKKVTGTAQALNQAKKNQPKMKNVEPAVNTQTAAAGDNGAAAKDAKNTANSSGNSDNAQAGQDQGAQGQGKQHGRNQDQQNNAQ